MNVKQHVLGASKNGQTEKSEKRTGKKRNKEILPFFLPY
jgi:hypothetical protein